MSLITLEAAKLHLRVDHDNEDMLIQLFIDAAEQSTADYLERSIYPDAPSLANANDVSGIVVNAALMAVVLLQLGNLYANREAITNAAAAELPLGVRHMLQPYRYGVGL